MAHQHAAIKDLRQTKKRTARNKVVKRNINFLRKAAMKAVELKDKAKASELLAQLTKTVDKAAGRNIIKKNNAARKKSRLAAKIKALA